MSLPSYVVNWNELLEFTEELPDKLGARSTKWLQGQQKTEGFMQSIPAIQAQYKVVSWAVPESIAVVGLTFNQSAWKSEDYWELWIDGELIFETVYTKELAQHKYWEVFHLLRQGKVIEVRLHNNSGNSRDVWVDIEYILIGEMEIPDETPIEPEEPDASPRVHFDGLIIGDVKWAEGSNYSLLFELNIPHGNIEEATTDILPFGSYPDASLVLPNSIRSTLDSIAVQEGARVLFYSEKNFQGDLVYDLRGKTVTYSGAIYEMWEINQSLRVKETWNAPYEEQFPLNKRTFLMDSLDEEDSRYDYRTHRMMHIYSQSGSFKIVPDIDE